MCLFLSLHFPSKSVVIMYFSQNFKKTLKSARKPRPPVPPMKTAVAPVRPAPLPLSNRWRQWRLSSRKLTPSLPLLITSSKMSRANWKSSKVTFLVLSHWKNYRIRLRYSIKSDFNDFIYSLFYPRLAFGFLCFVACLKVAVIELKLESIIQTV